MTFEKPDLENFEGLALAYQAMQRGGNIPTAYNAANERAVALFLDRRIRYLQIPEIIRASMEQAVYIANPNVDEILTTEQEVYDFIDSRW